ncbi:SPOR domain-containing protein [Thermodesulfobacteriota bacterium]
MTEKKTTKHPDKKAAIQKKPEKATLPKKTAAPAKKKIAKTTPVKAQDPPISDAPEEGLEALEKYKRLKEKVEGDNSEEALVVETDGKSKHVKEDKIHDKISSLVDGITLSEEDDESALEAKGEFKEVGTAAEDLLRKPEAAAESDEKIRASLDTGKTKGETEKIDKAKDEWVDAKPDAKHQKPKQYPVGAEKRKDETEKIDKTAIEVGEIEQGIDEIFSQFESEPKPDEKIQKIDPTPSDPIARKKKTKKPDKAEVERVDTESVSKHQKTRQYPVNAEKRKDKTAIEVGEIEQGIDEIFSQFESEPKPDEKIQKIDPTLSDPIARKKKTKKPDKAEAERVDTEPVGKRKETKSGPVDVKKITGKKEIRKTEDALVEMEPIIEDVLSKPEGKTKINEKPKKTITTTLDTAKPKDKIKTIDTSDNIFEKKKRHAEHGIKRIQKDKVKVEIKTPYAKAYTGKIKTKRIKRKSSRAIYIFGGVLIILFSAIAFTLFGPADKFTITETLRTFIAQKTDRSPEKPQAQKVVLPGKKAVVPEHEPDDLIDSTPSKKMLREKAIIIADEIKEFLMGWKTAWQNTAGAQGDIETYMSFYSDHFISEGLDKNGWKNDKAPKNRRKDWIQIELKEINIPETIKDGRVEVSFMQIYTSSNFSDESVQTLVLKREETGWKIINAKAGRDRSQQAVVSESITQKDAASLSQKVYPFTIHVASYRDEKNARSFITELKREGLPAFASMARIPGKGDWYRISIGVYSTLEEAQRAATKIKMQKSLNAIVVKKPYAIQVGVFDAHQSLKAMESDLRSKGYSSYNVPDRYNTGKIRLLTGAFDSEKDAAAQLRKLEDDLFSPKVVKR